MRLSFIAITEPGHLEAQSSLLFRSIRKYCGKYKTASIHSFQPRKGPLLKKETFELFECLEVKHHTRELNSEFAEFPRTNKVFSCAWAEKNLSEDIIVFLDSDTLFLKEPEELNLMGHNDVAVRPVEKKIVGSAGKRDPKDYYWQLLFEACHVPEPKFIRTSVDQKRIRAYWNSGLVAVRRDKGLFQQWEHDFLTIMSKNIFPPVKPKSDIGIPFLDQTALAVTLARIPKRIKLLPYMYNYPISSRPLMPFRYRKAGIEELVHIHYHDFFNVPGFLHKVTPVLNSESEKLKWITKYLPFEPIIEKEIKNEI